MRINFVAKMPFYLDQPVALSAWLKLRVMMASNVLLVLIWAERRRMLRTLMPVSLILLQRRINQKVKVKVKVKEK